MKAKIEHGTITLPPEALRTAALPENGECEIQAEPGELHVRPPARTPSGPAPIPTEHLRILREFVPVAIIDIIPDPADEAD